MENTIEVKNLCKNYGERCVVNNLSFVVKKGEVFGLLGHNGAGKTTTIEMMLGLKTIDHGYVSLLGMNPRKERKVYEKVGVQLQSSHYQQHMKVYEVCEERATLYKNPQDYKALLKRFHFMPRLDMYVADLSGGEKQKLSIVLALIGQPEIVFLDELTTGLDAVSRREVWEILKQLKQEGTTIVLTTHYLEEAEYLCDQIYLIKNGKKVISGSVQEIIESSPFQRLEEAYLWYMGGKEE